MTKTTVERLTLEGDLRPALFAWLDSGEMLVQEDSPSHTIELGPVDLVDRGGNVMRRLTDFPVVPGCRKTIYTLGAPLSGRRASFESRCFPDGPSPFLERVGAVVLDVATFTFSDASPLGNVAHGRVSWDRTGTRGIAAYSTDVCAPLVYVDSQGARFLDFKVNDSGHVWEARQFEPKVDSCHGGGVVTSPAWSPVSGQIAFLGASGRARFDKLASLYTMDLGSLIPRRLLTGLQNVGDLEWSPDGTRLAFDASENVAGRTSPGAYVYTPATGHFARLTTKPGQLQWSPDGRTLAVLIRSSKLPRRAGELTLVGVKTR